jgi:hypothetical protein
MKPAHKSKKPKKVRSEDVPRDSLFITGRLVLSDFEKMTARNGMHGVRTDNVSVETTRKIGAECVELKMTAVDFVAFFIRSQKPTAKLTVQAMLNKGWLDAAKEQLACQRKNAAMLLGNQVVRTKEGAMSAANLDPDMQVQVADIEAAFGYAWAQIRAVSGKCVIDEKAIQVLRLPFGNIEAWVRCFLSGLHPDVVRAHGAEAAAALQNNPLLKSTLQSLQMDVARLEKMAAPA